MASRGPVGGSSSPRAARGSAAGAAGTAAEDGAALTGFGSYYAISIECQ